MSWKVVFSRKVAKDLAFIHDEEVKVLLAILIHDLKAQGPFPGKSWANYGKLKGQKKNIDKRHCHIIKGRPTYVCCWEVYSLTKHIEVYYVGTHEKAPY